MRHSFETNPTIFGKILRGEIPCKKVYENEHVLAFHDIAPKAPVHILIVPKQHIESLQDITAADANLMSEIFAAANIIATQLEIKSQGYRLITNAGKGAGQEVPHLHFHLLSGPSGLPGF